MTSTGDGVLDVLAACEDCKLGGSARPGAILLWEGGSQLVGIQIPTATLTAPNPADGDMLGGGGPQGLWSSDVTGDGIPEVLASAPGRDFGGVTSAGAVFVWKGGTQFGGQVSATATLGVENASAFDSVSTIDIGDVSGDGIQDVLVSSCEADRSGAVDAGAIWVWNGRDAFEGELDPSATLEVPGAAAGDKLTFLGLRLADVSGDGVLDVLATAPYADIASASDRGAPLCLPRRRAERHEHTLGNAHGSDRNQRRHLWQLPRRLRSHRRWGS